LSKLSGESEDFMLRKAGSRAYYNANGKSDGKAVFLGRQAQES